MHDDRPSRRTPPIQYGWAGGCLGVVIGAVAWPIAMVVFEEDRDLFLTMALPFYALVGAFAGGVIGGLFGLTLRVLSSFSRGTRSRASAEERGDKPRG